MSSITSVLLLLFAIYLAVSGCGYLALNQRKHRIKVSGCDRQSMILPIAGKIGCLLVTASFVPCLLRDTLEFAILFWFFLVAGAAMCIAMVLAFKPQWLCLLVFSFQ